MCKSFGLGIEPVYAASVGSDPENALPVLKQTSYGLFGEPPTDLRLWHRNALIRLDEGSPDIQKLVKGVMIESYLVEGNQKIGPDHIYGKSITDPCLGWEDTEKLLYTIAELC